MIFWTLLFYDFTVRALITTAITATSMTTFNANSPVSQEVSPPIPELRSSIFVEIDSAAPLNSETASYVDIIVSFNSVGITGSTGVTGAAVDLR